MDTITLWTLGTLIFMLVCATTYLFYLTATKDETIGKMKDELRKLMRSFNDLDEQAKLIIRTDIELNKVQQEMDKRLSGLNALQRISRRMIQALNHNEIFQSIAPSLFEDLGFARVLIASLDENGHLKANLNLGFPPERGDALLKEVALEGFLTGSTQDTPTVSSITGPQRLCEKIVRIFEAEYFVFAPVQIQTGNIGFVFVGNRFSAAPVTQEDEQLITILAGQIGQSIENAQLFEKVFRSSQELELKVANRTKQLEDALQKVNEISNKKSEFVSAVSHELRTPLTSIKGYAAILIAGKIGEVPPAVKERLGKINSHSDALVGLINDLLDIARIESGRQEMKFSTYKVKDVVENISDLLTPQITAKSITLQARLAAGSQEIYVDLTQVERVFINLLSNAVKFTPPNGTITIEAAAANDGYAAFSVADTGIGIPAEDIQKLFSEFFRVDNEINASVKGTGLGLVLAKNIVQAHRGKIWVQSQVGRGTTFQFTLPCTQKAFEDKSGVQHA